MWARWCNLFLGVWLIIAPVVLDYPHPVPRMNDAIVGLLIATVALLSSLVMGLRFVNTLLGAWLVLSPPVLGYGDLTRATANDVIVGALVVCFSLVSAERNLLAWRATKYTSPT
ncbi:SPW repeat protein [Myxococcaceae bacterium JPH2]|nr:SPW repeat protein [Myxococcaceae bacterium JPH2]